MIRFFLHQIDTARARDGFSLRALALPRSTIQRWRSRQRARRPLLQKPGPRKPHTPDWPVLLASIRNLSHRRRRTAGTTALQAQHRDHISRRDLQQLVQEERDHQHTIMQRIHWLRPGTAWSMDATDFQGHTLVPLVDLASRYRFHPLIHPCQDGGHIATFLDAAFRQHGPPVFLKRDNGSPLNCHQVDAVLAEHKVLPLNSPPYYPPYNGAMEKAIGDFKRRLTQRLARSGEVPLLTAAVEATTHELNHERRRCLHGQTACELYHDTARRLSLNRRSRDQLLRLLTAEFRHNLQSMAAEDQHTTATVWRRTVETWLRCQGLIHVGPNTKTKTNCVNHFPSKMVP